MKISDIDLLIAQLMVNNYDMPKFTVDLISDAYNTEDPFEISKIAKEVCFVDIPVEDVAIILDYEEPIDEKEYRLTLAEHFKDIKYNE